MLLNFEELLVLNLLEHAVKAIFNAVLCPSRQLLHDLRPPVANLLPKSQDLEVFIGSEGLSVNLWVKEVVPPLSALLSIPLHT